MKRTGGILLTLVVALIAMPAHADLIDFEGVAGVTTVASQTTGSNTVFFGVGLAPTTACPASCAYSAQIGGPTTAFVPNDTPAGGVGGNVFLTDESNGPRAALNYYMSFLNPVSNLSLDLYDYRVDGGPSIGDMATLTVFSDLFGTAVGTAVFTIPSPNPIDGNVVNLAVLAPSTRIVSASVTFSRADIGTGIDNISFTTVPEPGTLMLLGMGLLGLAVGARRRQQG